MKQHKILGICLFLILLISFVHAQETLTLISNKCFNPIDCEAIMQVDTGIEQIIIPSKAKNKQFEIEFLRGDGFKKMKGYSLEIGTLQNTAYYEPVYDYRIEKTIYDKNVMGCPGKFKDIGATCEKEYSIRYLKEWAPIYKSEIVYGKFWGTTLQSNTTYYIRLKGQKQPKVGKNNVDWVITFNGIRYKEYAWWNTNWTNRECFTVTNESAIDANVGYPVDLNSQHFDFPNLCTETNYYDCLSGLTYNNSPIPLSMERIDNNKAWFQLQVALAKTNTTPVGESGYCLYYGNNTATAPGFTDINMASPGIDLNINDTNVTVALWHLEGDDTNDSSVNGYHLTENGTIDTNSAIVKYGLASASGFADADYFSLAAGAITNMDILTIELDFWMPDLEEPDVRTKGLLDYGWANAGSFLVYHSNNASTFLFVNQGCTDISISDVGIGLEEWHHLTVVFDGVNKYFYIDDVKSGETACSMTMGNYTLLIGRQACANCQWNGNIQNVRISNYTITPDIYYVPNGWTPNQAYFTKVVSAPEMNQSISADFNITITPAFLDPENGITSVSVDLNDISDYTDVNGNAWVWDENGVQFSTDQNVIGRTYNTVGDFNINLDVNAYNTANEGFNDTNWQVLSIKQAPQGVDFGADVNIYDANVAVKVDFNSLYTGSSDNFWWYEINDNLDFNYFSTDANATHTLTSPDANTFICLTVGLEDLNKTTCKSYYVTVVTVKTPLRESDESTTITPFDLTVITDPTQDYNTLTADTNYFIFSSNITDYQLRVDANGSYFGRLYEIAANGTHQTLQPYLADTDNGTSMTITVQNIANYLPIEGVTIRIYKNIGEIQRELIEEVITDSKGEALTSGIVNDSYFYEAEYLGVIIEDYDIIVTSTTIFILFNPSALFPLEENYYLDVTFTPGTAALTGTEDLNVWDVNLTQTIVYLNVDINNVTIYIKELDYNGIAPDTNLYNITITGTIPNGYQNTIFVGPDLNTWDANKTMRVYVRVTLNDRTEFISQQDYYAPISITGTFWVGMTRDIYGAIGCVAGQPCAFLLLVALLLSLGFTAAIVGTVQFQDTLAIAVIFCLCLGVFTLFTWVPFFLLVVICLLTVIVAIAGKGGT